MVVKQFQGGGRPPFWKMDISPYLSEIIGFCTQQQIFNWMNVTWSKMKISKIPDGGRPPFWKSLYRHIDLGEKSSDFHEILYTAADFQVDERHAIKNEKVALDRLRVRQNVFLVISYFLLSLSFFFSSISCGPCNNWHYLGHVKHVDDDDDDDDKLQMLLRGRQMTAGGLQFCSSLLMFIGYYSVGFTRAAAPISNVIAVLHTKHRLEKRHPCGVWTFHYNTNNRKRSAMWRETWVWVYAYNKYFRHFILENRQNCENYRTSYKKWAVLGNSLALGLQRGGLQRGVNITVSLCSAFPVL